MRDAESISVRSPALLWEIEPGSFIISKSGRNRIMKRIISLLLVSVLLFSLGVIGYAENETLTADLVLERLAATECETQEDQVVNGAMRLAEMTVTLDSMSIETQEEADQLNNILDNLEAINVPEESFALEAINVPEESFAHKRGVALTRVLDGLVIFQEQLDRDGRYTDQLNMILQSFDTCDDKAETADEQAMNALYHCVILASLIAQEHCSTQNMVNQVKKETAAFQSGDEAAADLPAQFVNGGESLLRMLTAIASMRDDGSYAENIQTISEDTYAAAEADDDPMYQLANWLYGCTSMLAVVVWQLEG